MYFKPVYLFVLFGVLSAFSFPKKDKITVWLIGDSTMAIKEPSAFPETGWGMPFVNFTDASVVIENRAKNGRSSGSFMKEGLWKPVAEQLKAGDIVLIQFGHNDEVKTKRSYTTEKEFQANLKAYISTSRLQHAIPVLITPVARRSFDGNGKLQDTHLIYAELVRKVARAEGVPLIDLDRKSRVLLEQLGVEGSKKLYNHLAKGEHPNYPDGKEDNTHFSGFGARKVAELVVESIREQHLPLADRLLKYPLKFTVSQDGSGDFKTIQEAVNATKDLAQLRILIYVKNGVYHEKLAIPSWKTRISIIGESREKTIITNNDYSGKDTPFKTDIYSKDKFSTFTSYTMLVQGNDCRVENLTLINDAGRVGQAVALHVEGDRVVIKNCSLLGNQDTLYAGTTQSRQYYTGCYIEGTTDFIFGEATVVFQDCTIKSLSDSYITAAATSAAQQYGFVFFDCKLEAAPAVKKVYLGRPWRPYAKTVFIRTQMGGHILSEGWDNWDDVKNEQTVFYGEYQSSGPGNVTGKRVKWSKQLTAKQRKGYTLTHIFGSWNPLQD